MFGVFAAGAAEPLRLASAYSHTSWSAAEGLPNPVRAVVQTPDGYLWLGTGGGLYRFDGRSFKRWQPDDGAAMESRSVLALLVTRAGELWVGFGSGGAARIADGRIIDYSKTAGAPRGGVQALAETPDGTIWAGGQYGIAKFANDRWSPVGAGEGYAAPAVQRFFCDGAGRLWAATDGFDYKLNTDGVRVNSILRLDAGASSFAPTDIGVGMVASFFEDGNGAVWASEPSAKAIFRVDGERSPIPMTNEPTAFVILNDGRIVAGSIGNGLQDVQFGAGNRIDNKFRVADGLSGAIVYSALKDMEGNIWFGTSGGLDRFRRNKALSFNALDGLDPDQQIAVTTTRDGVVKLFSYTGNVVWSAENGRFNRVDIGGSRRILGFGPADDGLLLGGSFKIARASGQTVKFEMVDGLEDDAAVEAVAEDAGGNLWITASGSKSTGRIFRRTGSSWEDVRTFGQLPPFRCRVIFPEAAGSVWLGFENGDVAQIDGRRVTLFDAGGGLLPGGAIYAITSDGKGGVLVGGEGGLTRINGRENGRVSELNGLPGNSVFGIVTDLEGDVWIAASRGILRIAPAELEKGFASSHSRLNGTVFDASDGLGGLPRQRQPFPIATRGGDGRLWFATSGGVAVIDPRNIPRNSVPPPVLIDSVRADDHPLSVHNAAEFPPGTRTLEFHFAALSFAAPEKVRYRYRLDGFDPDWRDASDTTFASYTGLPPGDYRFRVIASNNDGVWNEDGATHIFRIKPAFHETNWFRTAAAIVFVATLFFVYRLRVGEVKHNLQTQFEERLTERTRIARELHDTLLQGVVSASMQLTVALDEVPPGSPGRGRLERVRELIGEVLTDGRNTVRGLRADDPDDCDIEEKFAQIAAKANIGDREVHFELRSSGEKKAFHPVVADEIFAIGREALTNAFRHADATAISVEIDYGEQFVRVVVVDNGRGVAQKFVESGRDGHFGLVLMKERAAAVGGKIRIGGREGAGTSVELSVPSDIAFREQPRISLLRGLRKRLGMKEYRSTSS